MNIGIPRETHDDEKRVAATPESVKTLIRLGFDVSVESGAGEAAGFVDGAYEAAGAALTDAETVWTASDMVLKVRPPALAEAEQMKEGAALVAFVQPAVNPELVELLKTRRITALAMDQVPRITRAQKLDALSSMANIAGVYNESKTVLGLMPHPERLSDPQLGGDDGRPLFDGLVEALS